MPIDPTARRPLKTRGWPFFQKLAASLARTGVSPNEISFTSIIFGVLAGAALTASSATDGFATRLCFLGAAAFIQLRLIANLLDGMVAVEGGKGGPTGDLWNEAPDRLADAAILVGAGYALGSSPALGYLAALVAFFVAYTRALGASVGAGQVFLGPMAKPHRMFVMTMTCLLSVLFPPYSDGRDALSFHLKLTDGLEIGFQLGLVTIALLLIIVGGVLTSIRRLIHVGAILREKKAGS